MVDLAGSERQAKTGAKVDSQINYLTSSVAFIFLLFI